MIELFTCPLGHQWEAASADASESGRQTATCPVCSLAASAAIPSAGMVDEMPPRPKPVPAPAFGSAGNSRRQLRALQRKGPDDWPLIDGYEILEELGRGGMGVVYRARETSLDRTVALKMVLAEAHVGSEGLRRFRSEAEAAARLQHPNIVQIYHVGEENRQPYFAQEFVDGGNLAQRLAGTPLPVHEAARIVQTLAQAMHYAHERGVVHRDLKPANVLLTPDGVPKIADFGLAKRLDKEVGQTKTGLVMGTPSYMAPEQARGQTQEIGPPTDVYALGAILYELLTGRPPFRAATTVETMQQLLFEEVVAPTRLQPKVPRDLETICLKCLQREPQRRYGSALELAEDLGRFRAGEPIQARPVSRLERLGRWCRRNPRVAGLLTALILVFAGGFALVTWQWLRAEALRTLAQRQRNEAQTNYQLARRVVADYFATLNNDAELDQATALPLRKELLETALQHFQGFLQDRSDDPDLQAALATAHYCLGQVARLSDQDAEAVARYEKALAIQQQLVDQHSDQIRYQRDLARTYVALSRAQWHTGHGAEARHFNQQALDIRESLSQADPDNLELRRELIHSYQNTGFLLHASGEDKKALPVLQQARALREELVHTKPVDLIYQSDLSGTLNDLGLVLEILNRYDEALAVFREAIQLQQPVFTQARQAIRYRRLLTIHHFNMGRVLSKMGRSAEAAEAAQTCRQLNPEDPDALWFAARVLAMAANAVGKGEAEPSAADAERRRYADQAVKTLQEAIEYGFTDLKRLSWPAEFEMLSARPDFQQVRRDVEKRAQKGKP